MISPSPPSADDLRRGLIRLKLANDANWCYVNSTLLACLWAQLTSSDFSLEHWGPHANQLVNLLLGHDDEPMSLVDVPCFATLLTKWDQVGAQGDPVEFQGLMMRGLAFTGFDMRWEKRIQIGSQVQVMDTNDAHTPMILQFDPAAIQDNGVPLRHLIRDWTFQDGMVSALTTPTTLICVQVDRKVQSGDGSIGKSDNAINIHGGCEVPFFDADGLDIVWRDFQVISVITHIGTDTAGHCRTVLQAEHNLEADPPFGSLLTDDWLPAAKYWREPQWVVQNAVCFWLCSCDTLSLHHVPDDHTFTLTASCSAPKRISPVELRTMFAAATEADADSH